MQSQQNSTQSGFASLSEPKNIENMVASKEIFNQEERATKNEITISGRGIVISRHASGVKCAYDSRHRILQIPMEGGVVAELVQERTGSDMIYSEYRNQLLTVKNHSDTSVIEFSISSETNEGAARS
jgi:hypothetical protein